VGRWGSRTVVVLAAAVAVVGGSRFARADDAPAAPPPLGPTAGALLAVAGLAAGSALFAADDDHGVQRKGSYLLAASFALAPWVAHAGAGRPRRALAFGLLALAASTAMALEAHTDPFDENKGTQQRLPFELALSSAFFACAAGVIDGFFVAPGHDRAP
jgi:hypothetical protein